MDGDPLEPSAARRRYGSKGWDRQTAQLRARVALTLPTECAWCLDTITPDQPWHMDHITPLSAGGSNTIDNVQPLHAACNLAKAAQTIPPRYTPPPPSRAW